MRTVVIAAIGCLGLSACGSPAQGDVAQNAVSLRNLASTEEAAPRPAGFRVAGDPIATPSDAASRYFLLRSRRALTGPVVSIIRQERGDRVVYARTETDCARRLFHIVGTGGSRGEVETNVAHDGPLRPIAGLPLRVELADHICRQAGTPLAAAA